MDSDLSIVKLWAILLNLVGSLKEIYRHDPRSKTAV
ncbi:hypothetical protein EDC16_102330 [Testudinibacter aquarius]|uniref:Uncharacterized protein n=1 Tax=Testudinibacter aquarius TaxID=1524974 RepID=A0A4R3YG01_9PAST|nr:hypothetical protein EDC16_102330 [Testudinibacter aquarius]